MNGKLTWTVFWALVGVFIVIIGWFFFAATSEFATGFRFLVFLASSGAVFVLLGAALIFFTVKEKVGGMLKKFLILTGASPAGIIVSILLHNAVYGLFIYFFGADFWDRVGMGDEPFFFIMAIFVCPLGFLVGAVSSIVLRYRRQGMAE